jgi:hypothetical protein
MTKDSKIKKNQTKIAEFKPNKKTPKLLKTAKENTVTPDPDVDHGGIQLSQELNELLVAVAKGQPLLAGDKMGEVATVYPTLDQRLKVMTMLLKQQEQEMGDMVEKDGGDGRKKAKTAKIRAGYSADELRELLSRHLAELSTKKPAGKTAGQPERSGG